MKKCLVRIDAETEIPRVWIGGGGLILAFGHNSVKENGYYEATPYACTYKMPDALKSAALLLFAFFLVLLNGFFVAAEFAIVKVRSTRIDELAAKKRFGAKKAQEAVRHLDAYLSATQLGITLASLGLGYVGEPAFAHLIEPVFGALSETTRHVLSVAIAFTLITALHIVIGELAPKSLAIQRAEATTLAIIYPLDFFYRLFKLPIALLNWTASMVLRPFGLTSAGEHGGDAHSEDELRLILNASMAGGEIKASEVHLVNQVLDFGHQQAKDIMVPRPDVVFLDQTKTLSDNIAIADAGGYTRYPLSDGSPDRVIGMVHVKQLLAQGRHTSQDAPVDSRIVRNVLRVPETKPSTRCCGICSANASIWRWWWTSTAAQQGS